MNECRRRGWVLCRSACVVSLMWLAACATLNPLDEPLNVTLVSLQPVEMTLLEQRYRMRIRIQNPNPTELSVQGLSFKLELNGDEFAHGVSGDPFDLKGYGESLVDVSVVSTFFSVFKQIQQLQSGQLESIRYRISGKVSLAQGLSRIPFEREGELDLRSFQSGTVSRAHTLENDFAELSAAVLEAIVGKRVGAA